MSIATTKNGNTGLAERFEETETIIAIPSAMSNQIRAEIDVQIATAHRFPRSASRSLAMAKSLATLSPEVARSCGYALPRAGKTIEGPSVRLAEIIAGTWQNIRVAAHISEEGERHVTVQAFCMDLETNYAVSTEVRRRITSKDGKRYNDDMIQTTCNAALSIARRNAIFQVVPRAMVDIVYFEAMECARNSIASVAEDRDKWIAHFLKKGVSEKRIYAALGVHGRDDIMIDQLMMLSGFDNSLRDGGAKLADIFPEPLPAISGVERNPEENKAAHLGRALKAKQESTLINVDASEPGSEG